MGREWQYFFTSLIYNSWFFHQDADRIHKENNERPISSNLLQVKIRIRSQYAKRSYDLWKELQFSAMLVSHFQTLEDMLGGRTESGLLLSTLLSSMEPYGQLEFAPGMWAYLGLETYSCLRRFDVVWGRTERIEHCIWELIILSSMTRWGGGSSFPWII